MQTISPTSWNEFKAITVTNKNLKINYEERPTYYNVYAQEGLFLWEYCLLRDGNADVQDFEANVKPNANL
ncbi:MAG: hypothetical protein ACWGQW_08815 [bacterium]